MTTKRFLGVAAIATLAVSTVVLTQWGNASASPTEVRLHLATDAQRFVYGSAVQNLTVNKCAVNSPDSQNLINMSATPNSAAPGLVDYGLGVKVTPGSAIGTPCGQVDQSESITFSRGSAIAGRTFSGVQLDLEMTKNALVKLTFTGPNNTATYTLQTGTNITSDQANEPGISTAPPYLVNSSPGDDIDACAAPNSSGPNSGTSDNCEWTVNPGFNFTSMNIATLSGTVTLEGGNDFGGNPAFDTLFKLSNTAPSATADAITTNEDTAVNFNVLTNDSDPDGDPLAVTNTTAPSHGTVSAGTVAGALTYTPTSNYVGADSFSYTMSDGSNTATATVSITVTALNDPPVAVNSSPTTAEETAITIIVGTDVDSTVLTSTCSSGVPSVGTITDNGNGSITFTPPLNFNGPVTITCTVKDDKGASSQSQATVNVGVTPVNDAPVAVADSASVNQNRATPATNNSVRIPVSANDTDVDTGDVLTPSAVSDPPHGTTVVEGTDVRYTPDVDYTGSDSFTYRASDGHAQSNQVTVTVTVIRTMCSGETVTAGAVTGVHAEFTLLTDGMCKPYDLSVNDQTSTHGVSTVLFQPVGETQVDYRGTITFIRSESAVVNPDGVIQMLLEYDPEVDGSFKPVPLCDSPVFTLGVLTHAEFASVADSWCIASVETHGQGTDDLITTWQIWGHDDPQYR